MLELTKIYNIMKFIIINIKKKKSEINKKWKIICKMRIFIYRISLK